MIHTDVCLLERRRNVDAITSHSRFFITWTILNLCSGCIPAKPSLLSRPVRSAHGGRHVHGTVQPDHLVSAAVSARLERTQKKACPWHTSGQLLNSELSIWAHTRTRACARTKMSPPRNGKKLAPSCDTLRQEPSVSPQSSQTTVYSLLAPVAAVCIHREIASTPHAG